MAGEGRHRFPVAEAISKPCSETGTGAGKLTTSFRSIGVMQAPVGSGTSLRSLAFDIASAFVPFPVTKWRTRTVSPAAMSTTYSHSILPLPSARSRSFNQVLSQSPWKTWPRRGRLALPPVATHWSTIWATMSPEDEPRISVAPPEPSSPIRRTVTTCDVPPLFVRMFCQRANVSFAGTKSLRETSMFPKVCGARAISRPLHSSVAIPLSLKTVPSTKSAAYPSKASVSVVVVGLPPEVVEGTAPVKLASLAAPDACSSNVDEVVVDVGVVVPVDVGVEVKMVVNAGEAGVANEDEYGPDVEYEPVVVYGPVVWTGQVVRELPVV